MTPRLKKKWEQGELRYVQFWKFPRVEYSIAYISNKLLGNKHISGFYINTMLHRL